MTPSDNSPESLNEPDPSPMPPNPEVNGQNGGGSAGPFPGPAPIPVTPELLAWAMRKWNEEEEREAAKGIREILEEDGGLELADFLPELKRAAGIND